MAGWTDACMEGQKDVRQLNERTNGRTEGREDWGAMHRLIFETLTFVLHLDSPGGARSVSWEAFAEGSSYPPRREGVEMFSRDIFLGACLWI